MLEKEQGCQSWVKQQVSPMPWLCATKRRETHHGRHGEIPGMHLLGEPIDLPSGVDEDDGLGDGQGFIQVTQRVQLPLLQTGSRREHQPAIPSNLLLPGPPPALGLPLAQR